MEPVGGGGKLGILGEHLLFPGNSDAGAHKGRFQNHCYVGLNPPGWLCFVLCSAHTREGQDGQEVS